MNPLHEITFATPGMDRSESEKLQAVLVLAEIRLNASWVESTRPGQANVVICRDLTAVSAEEKRPVILLRPATETIAEAESGTGYPLFELVLDSNGMPSFSELIHVFGQVETRLQEVPAEQTPAATPDHQATAVDESIADVQPIEALPVAAGLDVVLPTEEERAQELAVPIFEPRAAVNSEDESPAGALAIAEQEPPAPVEAEVPEPAEATIVPVLQPVMSEVARAVVTRQCLEQLALYVQGAPNEGSWHKILLQSGDVMLLDFEQGRFYSNRVLESFLVRLEDNRISYISTLSRSEFSAELSKQYCDEQPLANLQWFLALYSGISGTELPAEDETYSLSGWPDSQLPGLRQEHLKLAAFMRGKPATIKRIADQTGIAVSDIQTFVEACRYQGLVQQDGEQKSEAVPASEQPKGFWRQILRTIKR
ncbi:hypothetical protein [Marinobacterium weihaiense]|uniref:Uncharacterized protein n=1 Tax=Marinobacterium weihaiense TaxID=2851016 RepID=A0ABS6M8T0_9GAMM|nr:hypothetical protein [Marinobacterium weihaiense]MBV0932595.1 hypothetical protein [Marinobacterium weihaiense]